MGIRFAIYAMINVGSHSIPIAKSAMIPPLSSRIGSMETMATITSLERTPDRFSTNHAAKDSAKDISSLCVIYILRHNTPV
jgi:hypothetical protein